MQNPYRFNQEHHLHELNVDGVWKPLTGTSSVLSVIAKPLTYWASGLAVKEFGCPDPKVLTKIKNKKASQEEIEALHQAANARLSEIEQMTIQDYIKLLDKAYRAHATTLKETADEGVDLHAELERFVRFRMALDSKESTIFTGPPWHPRIEPFIKWTDANVDRFLWAETHCFSRKWHLGGISDCGFIDKDGRMGILDFKSSKEAYFAHWAQIGGYDLQISENGGFDAEGNLTIDLIHEIRDGFDYYCVLPFGMEEPKVQVNKDVEGCKANFLHALALYRAIPRDS